MDWKLKLMQVLDAVAEHEQTWFEPWPGISAEEQKEIEEAWEKYKLQERPLYQKAGL